MKRLSVALGTLLPGLACAPSQDALHAPSLARMLRDQTPVTVAEHHRILVDVIDGFGGDPPAGLELERAYYAWLLGAADEVAAAVERARSVRPDLGVLIDRAARHIRTLRPLGDCGGP